MIFLIQLETQQENNLPNSSLLRCATCWKFLILVTNASRLWYEIDQFDSCYKWLKNKKEEKIDQRYLNPFEYFKSGPWARLSDKHIL